MLNFSLKISLYKLYAYIKKCINECIDAFTNWPNFTKNPKATFMS